MKETLPSFSFRKAARSGHPRPVTVHFPSVRHLYNCRRYLLFGIVVLLTINGSRQSLIPFPRKFFPGIFQAKPSCVRPRGKNVAPSMFHVRDPRGREGGGLQSPGGAGAGGGAGTGRTWRGKWRRAEAAAAHR